MLIILLYLGAAFRGDRRQHDPTLFEKLKAREIQASLAARQVRRRLRDEQLTNPTPLPGEGFDLIYADPPRQLGNPDAAKAPEQHYPTMELEQIKAMQPPAAKHAVVYLWAVNSQLPVALEVMPASSRARRWSERRGGST